MSLEKWQEFVVVVVALLAIVFIVCQMTNGASLVAETASDSLTCTLLLPDGTCRKKKKNWREKLEKDLESPYLELENAAEVN